MATLFKPLTALLVLCIAFSHITAQSPGFVRTQLSGTTHFLYEEEKLFVTESGVVYYAVFAPSGYYVEKLDENLDSKAHVLRKFEEDDNVGFSAAVLMKEDIYIVTGIFNKKSNESEFYLTKLNSTLNAEQPRHLLNVPGRLESVLNTNAGPIAPTRALVSQSESYRYWSLTVITAENRVDQAQFSVALFDNEGTMLNNNKTFDVKYVSDAFIEPVTKTGNDGNVYLLSHMAFDGIPSSKYYRHIFCISDEGSQLNIFSPRNYSQYHTMMAPTNDGNVIVYSVTGHDMLVKLINGSTGAVIREHTIGISDQEWKDNARHTGETMISTMVFPPVMVGQASNGDIYVVGEQYDPANGERFSFMIAAFNSVLELKWQKVVSRYNGGLRSQIQPYIIGDQLTIFMNYKAIMFEMDLYEGGKIDGQEYESKMKGLKGDPRMDIVVFQGNVSGEGLIEWKKIAENDYQDTQGKFYSLKEQSYFIPGSAVERKGRVYFISGGTFEISLKPFYECRRDVCVVSWE